VVPGRGRGAAIRPLQGDEAVRRRCTSPRDPYVTPTMLRWISSAALSMSWWPRRVSCGRPRAGGLSPSARRSSSRW